MIDNIMIFCTCSSNNNIYYLNRIKQWYQYLSNKLQKYNIDFFVISDGIIEKDILLLQEFKDIEKNIKFVYLTPVLGIRQNNFLGWRRSISKALQIGRNYKYILHIQNDVKFLNFQKLEKYLFNNQMYVGYANPYPMIDSAVMILNNKQKNEQLIKVFKENLKINILMENFINNLLSPIIIFNGIRYEHQIHRLLNKTYDYIGQLDDFNQFNI